MRISSRTPEGKRNECPVCGKSFVISPSAATGDAPCPRCGSLVWFETEAVDEPIRDPFVRDVYIAPAFKNIRPSSAVLPVVIEVPTPGVDASTYSLGLALKPFIGRWSRQRRDRARRQLNERLHEAAMCISRESLERLIGEPQLLFFSDSGHRNEFYETILGNLVLRFEDSRLIAIFGMIPFSSLEWGAGLKPDPQWHEVNPKNARRRVIQ